MSRQPDDGDRGTGVCSDDVGTGGATVSPSPAPVAAPPVDSHSMGLRSPSLERERRIMALAARQHGVVGRSQLLDAGIPAHVIDHRVRRGRLYVLHRGVYRVGPLMSDRESAMAAVLACGEGSAVSHRSGAGLLDLLLHRGAGEPVDVSVPRGYRVPARGIRVHRAPGLRADEISQVDGIPVTSPLRTLLDLATVAGERELEQALARADRQGLVTASQLSQYVEGHRGRAGTRRLAALLGRVAGPALTRSEAEARFLALIRAAELRAPEANVVVEGFEVDFLWREERLVVEIDGQAYHASATAFERDRRRDAVLAAAGLRVVRVTWRQLTGSPTAVLVRLAQALARAQE